MIRISNLVFDYPGQRALHGIDCHIAPGSVTALVGANGAGKTTLMRCIAGLEVPVSGTIQVDGIDVLEKPREVHRLMGYLSDFFGLYQELTVRQCLTYAAAAQGLAAQDIPQAVASTAQRLEFSDGQLAQVCGSLSRGWRQRVAIGQAIIHRPRLLVLDEPASGLDPEARSSLAHLFRQLQAEGMTILVSSHILAELDEYSTHMLVLRAGCLIEHRALATVAAATGNDTARQRIYLELAQPDEALPGRLRQQAGIELIRADSQSAEFDFSADPSEQARLLAALIAGGLAVACFTRRRENLQQSYFASIEAHRPEDRP